MKEPYGEGVASHSDPESCDVDRKVGGEALTGARVGWVSSREILTQLQGADAVRACGRQHHGRRHRKTFVDPARSKTPRTHGTSSRGSREIPRPVTEDSAVARTVNPLGARRS